MPETTTTYGVLIVDDDQVYRMLVREILLRAGGFEIVGEASDGHEALEKVDGHTPDVILLDLMMPNMDGFTALPKLREAAPAAHIVVLTALDEEEATAEAVLLGMDRFLEKRHVADRLVPGLRSALG